MPSKPISFPIPPLNLSNIKKDSAIFPKKRNSISIAKPSTKIPTDIKTKSICKAVPPFYHKKIHLAKISMSIKIPIPSLTMPTPERIPRIS
jgi:hypothetical protein